MKTSELTGALLDYWVARAEGSTDAMLAGWSSGTICLSSHHAFEDVPFRPSTNWSDGGPLIDKYRMQLVPDDEPKWFVVCNDRHETLVYGETLLQAICRAVVRSVFGDEVGEVPAC